MFPFLAERFQAVFDKLSGRGVLRDEHVREAAREMRLNLLAADVHFKVVKEFVDAVSARAVGTALLSSIAPHQQFAKIVCDELTSVLGSANVAFDFAAPPPLIVMLVGLQGSGKTTTAAKFASFCRDRGRRPLIVPADVHRPAAIEQLMKLSRDLGIECVPSSPKDKAVAIAKDAVSHARRNSFDTVIIDTAGRLHIDDEMMTEAKRIAHKIEPQRILYVADAMTGQDAAASSAAFNEALPITGIVLTKLDGDARGGAALSIRAVTGKPILFVGVGEKMGDFEQFHPDRMARRILGMGDVLSLVEQLETQAKTADIASAGEAFASGIFTLEDYRTQLGLVKKLGSADKLIGLLPGIGRYAREVDGAELKTLMKRREAILSSMTPGERKNPDILNGSRRRRIAAGSGVEVAQINRMIKEFRTMQSMMKSLKKGGMKKLFKGLTGGMFS